MTDANDPRLEPTPQGSPRRYSRISLELSHTWPGEMYLRFETGPGMAVMIGVTEADLEELRRLIDLGDPGRGRLDQ